MFTDLFYPYLLGGGENRCFEIAKRLIGCGNEVSVITTSIASHSRYEELEDSRLKIFRFGFPPHPTTHRSLITVPGYILSSIINRNGFEDCDLFDLNTYASALTGKFIAFLKRKPSIITVHDVFTPNWFIGHGLHYTTLGMLAENILAQIHKQKHFITVSRATKNKMIRRLKINPRQIHVVPNGVDFSYVNEIASKSKKNTADSFKKVVYVGRLISYKNVDHIIYAIKSLLNKNIKVVLDIVGSGTERKKLEKLTVDLGVNDRVNFHGFLKDSRKVIELISQSDILVNPSSFEGFGIVLLEAMASKTPVLAYDLPAYHEFAINGHNATLVESNRIRELVNALQLMLTNEEVSSMLIKNGYETAKKYDWDSIINRLESVYERVLLE